MLHLRVPTRRRLADYVSIRVRLCSDSSGANWVGMTLLVPADGGEHWIYGTQWTAGQGTFVVGTSTITHVMVEDRNDVANLGWLGLQPGETLYVGQIFLNPKGRAKALVRVDDGPGSLVSTPSTFLADGVTQAWTHFSLCQRFGFRGNVALSTSRIGSVSPVSTWASWNDIRTLHAAGWDMAVQSHAEPQDVLNRGARLLGPVGFARRAIASVDSAANTITAVANNNLPSPGTYAQFPAEFEGGALPVPLVPRNRYWLREVTATSFTVHPTENDAVQNANVIDLTSAGDAATMSYFYAGSAADESAILSDYNRCQELIVANGVSSAEDVVCLNQGAGDPFVAAALAKYGAALVCGIQGAAGGANTIGCMFAGAKGGDTVVNASTMLVGGPLLAGVGAMQTDGAVSEANIRARVQAACAAGLVFMNYHHALSVSNGPSLAFYLDELRIQQDAGAVDVITFSELREYMRLFSPLPVPTSQTAI
jgi:hypothetical protein